MNIVIQNLDDQYCYGLATALKFSGFDPTLWRANQISIFDMFAEKRPDVLVVHARLAKEKMDELEAARNKYGGKLFLSGFNIGVGGGDIYGLEAHHTANILEASSVADDPKYKCNFALICNYIRDQDYDYIDEMVSKIGKLGFRIYGSIQIPSPYYVGKVGRGELRKIYKNTGVLIDLYGEHYYNSFLFNNISFCELLHNEKEYQNISSLDDIIMSIEELSDTDMNRLKIKTVVEHNNFKPIIEMFDLMGFNDQKNQVIQAEKRIINEHWNIGI